MATRSTGRTRTRPGRPLAFILLTLVALTTLVVVKEWEPRRGLDLVGGTSVILTPKGEKPSSGALASAVDIIRRRVNGTGVTSAEVVTEGENVRVSLPNVGRTEALRIVGTTAELTFRSVLQAVDPGPPAPVTATPAPTGTAKPTATPKSTASPKASPTSTARPRPLAGVLLPAQTSPTPTPKATATPTRRPTATPTAQPTPSIPRDIQQALAEVDCRDAEQRAEVADVYGDPSMNTKEILSCEEDGSVKYVLGPSEMGGKEIKGALATIRQDANGVSTGEWMVELTMKSAKKWGDLTKKYTGQQIAIVLDGIVQSAPRVEAEIPNGIAQITGDFNERSANGLANVLKYGSLPVQFEQSQTQTISATLGDRSLNGAVLAGLLGLGAVLLYAILYYRALGLVTIVGMLIFAGLNFLAIVVLGQTMGFTLTLAGIAGLIVSVGISADSYVVFYERLRDEIRSGKSVQAGVERGFKRAFFTILTADGVSFLAALILYALSVGEVRGFAFTLGLATLIDVFVAWLYTRPVVTLLARTRMFREGRFGGLAGTRQLKGA
ncbi:MAG TPA: protein translocase subunit SecD [Frankiaceae bacterium]|nr:protein translocase subunit SecD [Frankiaceae bacterium]